LTYTADRASISMDIGVYVICLSNKTSFSYNCFNNRVTPKPR